MQSWVPSKEGFDTSTEDTGKFESREQVVEAATQKQDLSGADLSGLDLAGIKLTGLKMEGTYLSAANLEAAVLAAGNMAGVDLAGAQMNGARTAAANMGLFQNIAWYGKGVTGHPVGGSLAFARAIERRYLDLGGEIHYDNRVVKILVEAGPTGRGDRAVGVRLPPPLPDRARLPREAELNTGRTLSSFPWTSRSPSLGKN